MCYLAHDVREDGAGGADERADDGQEGRAEHEALRAEGPAGVAVERGDDDGHVGAAHGARHVRAEDAGERRAGAQEGEGRLGGAGHAEAHGAVCLGGERGCMCGRRRRLWWWWFVCLSTVVFPH